MQRCLACDDDDEDDDYTCKYVNNIFIEFCTDFMQIEKFPPGNSSEETFRIWLTKLRKERSIQQRLHFHYFQSYLINVFTYKFSIHSEKAFIFILWWLPRFEHIGFPTEIIHQF